jgi:hypothetical protein
VTDAAGLTRALANARGGDTLLLAPGDYGALDISERTFTPALVIAAASPGARFGRITLDRVQGLTFRDIRLAAQLEPGETDKTRYIQIGRSARIAWLGGAVGGTADGNPDNDGIGMSVRGSTDVTVRGVRFHDLYRGAVFASSQKLRVEGNRIETVRSDGFNFVGVQDAVIANNLFRDFFYSKERRDHPDFIQFWSRGVGPSSDVTIAGNIMLEGEGSTAQGIFIDNKTGREGGVTQFGEPHRNFTVRNNLYHGSSLHGITLGGITGGRVENNTIVAVPDSARRVSINVWRAEGVAVSGNIACGFASGEGSRQERVRRRQAARAGTPEPQAAPAGNVLLRCRDRDAGTNPSDLFPTLSRGTAAEALVPRGAAEGWRPGGVAAERAAR